MQKDFCAHMKLQEESEARTWKWAGHGVCTPAFTKGIMGCLMTTSSWGLGCTSQLNPKFVNSPLSCQRKQPLKHGFPRLARLQHNLVALSGSCPSSILCARFWRQTFLGGSELVYAITEITLTFISASLISRSSNGSSCLRLESGTVAGCSQRNQGDALEQPDSVHRVDGGRFGDQGALRTVMWTWFTLHHLLSTSCNDFPDRNSPVTLESCSIISNILHRAIPDQITGLGKSRVWPSDQ